MQEQVAHQKNTEVHADVSTWRDRATERGSGEAAQDIVAAQGQTIVKLHAAPEKRSRSKQLEDIQISRLFPRPCKQVCLQGLGEGAWRNWWIGRPRFTGPSAFDASDEMHMTGAEQTIQPPRPS